MADDAHQFESLIDYSEYDNFESPSLSPTRSKAAFVRPVKMESPTTGTFLSAQQPMSGPSHQYDLYKQQTGIVPGALASTLAVNQMSEVQGYSNYNLESLGTSDFFDFNTVPSQPSMGTSDVDMEFDSPSGDFFFNETTVNPTVLGAQEPNSLSPPPVMAPQASNVGRMWPGMHQQQAALAKAQAQAQQRQQHQQQHQQQQQQMMQQRQPETLKPTRAKGSQPTDPIVEQKISQLLNSMRGNSAGSDEDNMPLMNVSRPRKDEEDMDEDERLLASEEGKKLSSKERRQLRNKVSARAFRSRRKEYITQLEAEIAGKVSENGDLRAENRALVDENKRLTDLTRMLLSSPSFSDFLDRLSTNPQGPPQLVQPQAQAQAQAQQQHQHQQSVETRPLPKDVNPYAAQNQVQQQQIGIAMMPEQTMDFSMLNLNGGPVDGFTFQPQVYAVLETPEPAFDSSLLMGKTSNFVGEQLDDEDEKPNMPVIASRPRPVGEKSAEPVAAVIDEEFDNDPAFALWHDDRSTQADAKGEQAVPELDVECLLPSVNLFGHVEVEKVSARIELVDAAEAELKAGEEEMARQMATAQRMAAGMEGTLARLEMLTAEE